MPDWPDGMMDVFLVGATVAAVVFSPAGSILFATNEAKRVLRRPWGLVGVDWPYESTFRDEDGELVPADEVPLRRAMATGERVRQVLHLDRADGFNTWLDLEAIPGASGAVLLIRAVEAPVRSSTPSVAV